MDFFYYFSIILNYWPHWLYLTSWDSSWNPACHLQECCTDKWITFDKAQLHKNLSEIIYGQPLLGPIVDALAAHLNSTTPPKKALTLSFNGATGTGKNYVAQFIAESMFREGFNSNHVHYFNGRTDFPLKTNWQSYKLESQIKMALSQCPRGLFILDEIDQMSPELLNSIKPLIDLENPVRGVDSSKAVFIFLSNTGSQSIYKKYKNNYDQGRSWKDLTPKAFEKIIRKGDFHETGGFHLSYTTKSDLIDHYIPFLPIDSQQVNRCIMYEFDIRKVPKPKPEAFRDVLKYIKWDESSDPKVSKSGCKKVTLLVEIIMAEHYVHLLYEQDKLKM